MSTARTRNNKFRSDGKRHFVNEIGSALEAQEGIRLELITLDREIGAEVVLVLTENRKFLDQLRRRGPLDLRLNAGAVNTSCGPVLFMLWWFAPLINGKPFAGYELLISPETTEGLSLACKQTHLHLVILDERNEIFDVVEFVNVYGLDRLVDIASEIRPKLVGYDFARVRNAFFQEIPQESLL